VWLVRDGAIHVYELVEGRYREVAASLAFPKLNLALVMRLLDEPTMSNAMRKMQAYARG
jgi:hypothetical protein